MNLDETAFPAYELFDLEQYQEHESLPGFSQSGAALFAVRIAHTNPSKGNNIGSNLQVA